MQHHPPTAAKVSGSTTAASSRPPAFSPAGGGISPSTNSTSTERHSAEKTSTIPKTERPTTRAERVKSNIRKILLASPLFPRFYADIVISSAPNSIQAKILRDNYSKILSQVNLNMANNSCTHIKVTGVRCGSPIDLKRATLILRALHIAVKNARRVKFNAKADMVKEVPEFAAPDPSIAEQDNIDQSLKIPPYNPDASKPGYVRTRDEMIRDGVIRPGTRPKQTREDLFAHYYGYPNAAAHAAALAAEKSKNELSVERAPTPANAEATTNAASADGPNPTVEERPFSARPEARAEATAAGTINKEGTSAPAGNSAEISQHDTSRTSRKPATGTRTIPHTRIKAHHPSANA